jgi:hypothetical protein
MATEEKLQESKSTPTDIRLVEISIDKKSLINSLLPFSFIGTTLAVGVLVEPDGSYGGINFNRGVEQIGCDYSTALYASCPIFDDENNHFKFFVDKWPTFLASCSPQFINSIKTLLSKNDDQFELRLSYFISSASPAQAESHFMVFGKSNANVGSCIKHPVSLDESILVRATNPNDLHYYR